MWYAWWGILKFRFDIYTQNRYLKNQFLWFIIRSYQYDSWMYTILIAYASARMTIYQIFEWRFFSFKSNKQILYTQSVCVSLFFHCLSSKQKNTNDWIIRVDTLCSTGWPDKLRNAHIFVAHSSIYYFLSLCTSYPQFIGLFSIVLNAYDCSFCPRASII